METERLQRISIKILDSNIFHFVIGLKYFQKSYAISPLNKNAELFTGYKRMNNRF